jgi:hypothetical protein
MNMNLDMMNMNNSRIAQMPSARVAALTRDEITAAAKRLRASRPAKWTVIVEGRELPARPLILEAAGVPPNDPTNSHQAVKILEEEGFDVRYEGRAMPGRGEPESQAERAELIRSLRGCLKGDYSLVEDREREHRIEKRP